MGKNVFLGSSAALLVAILAAGCGDDPVEPTSAVAPKPAQALVENDWHDFAWEFGGCVEPIDIAGRYHAVATLQENDNRWQTSWRLQLIGSGAGRYSGAMYRLNASSSGSESHGTEPEYPLTITVHDRIVLTAQAALPDLRGRSTWHLTINANGTTTVELERFDSECSQERPQGPGRTLVVNVTDDADDGSCSPNHCSLREAIRAANALPGVNTVAFDIPGAGPHTIQPTSELPWVISPAVIDGTSEPDYAGTPVVEVSGDVLGGGTGISILAGHTTLRGLAVNGFDRGVWLAWNGGNVLQGNHVGTDPSGTAAKANGDGIHIEDSADNLVGGTTPEEGNLVSGNLANGIVITGEPSRTNAIRGNRIGTDVTGTLTLGNGNAGVLLGGSTGNTVGGTLPGAGNVISGNLEGIALDGASGNAVEGNFIGTDFTGTASIANETGVLLLGPDNTIGGVHPAARNVISGNDGNGLSILAPRNTVQGNIIGADVTGTASLPNRTGIFTASPGNTIGGPVPGAGNLVSGNHDFGVHVVFAPWNRIMGNVIGTDLSGTAALSNGMDGVFLEQAAHNVVGGTVTEARNLVSGNGGNGIGINGEGSHDNVVLGNYVGTDVTGTLTLGNGNAGVLLGGSNGNAVGGTMPGAGNLISGNLEGVTFDGAFGNRVEGNLIGTDLTGTAAIANGTGILLLGHENTIGGVDPAARNVISGNTGEGVNLDLGAARNQIIGNFIGTDVTGTVALGNGERGIRLNDAYDNTVGGGARGAPNVVSANFNGIALSGGASGNAIRGNLIGTDVSGAQPLGNLRSGVAVTDGAAGNPIGGRRDGSGNTIAFNGFAGIRLRGGGAGNAMEGNSIFENGRLGIDLGDPGVTPNDPGDPDTGDNDLQNFPVLTAVDVDGIAGTLNSTPDTDFRVQFFANDACDPAEYGEGRTVLGQVMVTTDGSGDAEFLFEVSVPAGSFITATATNPDRSTSEFSACVPTT